MLAAVCLVASTMLLDAQDPTSLERALALAEAQHESVGIADAQVAATRASLRAAWAQLLPSLSVGYNYRLIDAGGINLGGGGGGGVLGFPGHQLNASATLTLLDASAFPAIAAADQQVEAASLRAGEARRRLQFLVAEAYLTVLATERVVTAAHERVQVASRLTEAMRERVRAGMVPGTALTRAELELATAKVGVTSAERARVGARATLQELVGQPLGPLEPLADNFAGVPDTELERKDVLATQLDAAAAHKATWQPWLRLVPTLSVSGSGIERFAAASLSPIWVVTLNLSWALYDGGRRYAEAALLEALAQQRALEARAATRQVPIDLQRSAAELRVAEAGLNQAEARLEVARRNAAEIGERATAGLASSLELADASASVFEAEAALAGEILSLQTARLALRRVLGHFPQ